MRNRMQQVDKYMREMFSDVEFHSLVDRERYTYPAAYSLLHDTWKYAVPREWPMDDGLEDLILLSQVWDIERRHQ